MAQDTVPHRDWTAFVALLSLAGNYKDQAFSLRMGVQNKACQNRMRPLQRHAVKIDLALWPQLSPLELTKGFLIHLDGRLPDMIMDGWREIV